MADSRISDLDEALTIESSDLFVVEQSSTAKSVSGQLLTNTLASLLDGHGGIASIVYTAPVSPSLVGTLTITMTDTSVDPIVLSVTNGRGISGITWTETGTAYDGQTHTGTIAYNDGTSSQVVIHDGYKGDTGDQTNVWIRWAQNQPTQDSDMSLTVGPYIGIAVGTQSTAPTSYLDYAWYEYKGETGDTGASIADIHRTSGDGSQGSVDVYAVDLDDGTTLPTTFTVYQGRDGTGLVNSVNEIGPDNSGDVTLTAGDIYDGEQTQAEINEALTGQISNAKLRTFYVANNNATKTIYFDGEGYHVLFVISGAANSNQISHIRVTSADSVTVTDLVNGSNITVTTGTGRITVKNAAANQGATIGVLTFTGNAPT